MAAQGSTEDDDEDATDGEGGAPDEPIVVEVGDQLDLHTFAPRDVKALVADYLELAVECGFAEVRIIHGKGQGTLRRIVHGVLEGHPLVAAFRLAGDASSWGATVVTLRR
jgi:dsDNA-specific endonuclease/ATPase MutS2